MLDTLKTVINFVNNKDLINGNSKYLRDLAKFIGELLKVDYLLINKYSQEDPTLAETVAIYTKNGFAPNFTYPLAGTPCQNVMEANFCSYESGVQQLFPEDKLLEDMEVESYIGAPLWDANNQQIGAIIVMNKSKIDDVSDIELILKTVSGAAGIELERKIFNSKLKTSEARFHQLLQSSEDMITIHNLEGKVLYYNNPTTYPFSLSEIIHKMPDEILEKEASNKLMKVFKKVVNTGKSETIERRLNLFGKESWFFEYIYPITNKNGEAVELVRICRDINQRKLSEKKFEQQNQKLLLGEKELKASNKEYLALNQALNQKNEEYLSLLKSNENQKRKLEQLYYTLIQAQKLSNIGSWQWNSATDEAEWSDQMYNIYGVEKGVFYPSNENVIKMVVEEDYPKFEQGLGVLLDDQIFTPFEFRIKRPSGEIRTLFIMALEKGESGTEKENMVLGVTQDVTTRKEVEDKIIESLEEKELLLRELYHRTKNNMQVISSMLSMKLMFTENQEVKELLSETKNKILGMALVHEKLYQANDLTRINLKEYLEDLIKLLKDNLISVNHNIKVETTLENIESNIDTAIPCGMVVNEIFTNSIKHAFRPNEMGTIKVTLYKDQNQMINLIIADNGKGIPSPFDIYKCHSYGLQSVVMLSKLQLGGSIQMKNKKGTEFILMFNEGISRNRV